MPRNEITVVSRGGGDDSVTLVLAEEIGNMDNLDYDRREISYSLRFLSDTNEVVLIKGDEILHSEEVS